jgi:Fe-S-cluster containining protein
MDIHFTCVRCGNCCHDLKIPLTVAEAIQWLGRGDQVQLLFEASPWPASLSGNDPPAAHFKSRSFAARSGSLPARVVVMLVANFTGACPNLLGDGRCGIYETRPLVCRIYPAEINPFVVFKPENKGCPPEAWAAEHPLLQRDGRLVDQAMSRDVRLSRDTDAADADVKRRLCGTLRMRDAALVHEAVLMYSPPPQDLVSALMAAVAGDGGAADPGDWRFVSDQQSSIDRVVTAGGIAVNDRDAKEKSYQYVPFARKPLFDPYGSATS